MTAMGVDRPAHTTAWRGEAVEGDTDWFVEFDTFDLDRLVARAAAIGRRIDDGELTIGDVDAVDAVEAVEAVDDQASMPDLEALAQWLRRRLFDGHGFALVRGLPVDDLDDTAGTVLFWLLGRTIGSPLHQNAAGDVLIRVRDEGKSFDEPGVRAYETTADLQYHTDSSDVVGLLCRRPAVRGGVSTIVSSAAVVGEIERRRPDLAARLFEPWPELNPVDGSVTERPIAARASSGRIATRYGRKYTELAAAQRGVPLTAAQVEALDLFDAITNDPAFVLNMHFRPGDVQFLNNHLVLHARTAYEDGNDPGERRELWRLWLVAPELDVPDVFTDTGFIARTAVTDT